MRTDLNLVMPATSSVNDRMAGTSVIWLTVACEHSMIVAN